MRICKINTDGNIEFIWTKRGLLELEVLQRLVGGQIEIVNINRNLQDDEKQTKLIMICDEEGKIKGKELNSIATGIALIGKDDCIVGDVLIVDSFEEELFGLSVEQCARLIEVMA